MNLRDEPLTTSSKLPDIPEFTSWTLFPLVIACIIAIEVYRKKQQDKMSANLNYCIFTGKLGCESRSLCFYFRFAL